MKINLLKTFGLLLGSILILDPIVKLTNDRGLSFSDYTNIKWFVFYIFLLGIIYYFILSKITKPWLKYFLLILCYLLITFIFLYFAIEIYASGPVGDGF